MLKNPIIENFEYDKLYKWKYSKRQKMCCAYYLTPTQGSDVETVKEIFKRDLEYHPRMTALFSDEEYDLIAPYFEEVRKYDRAIGLITPLKPHYTHAPGPWPNNTSRWLYLRDKALGVEYIELSRYDYRNTVHKSNGLDGELESVNCGVVQFPDYEDHWTKFTVIKKH